MAISPKSFALLVAGGLLLTGCKVDMHAELYIRDLWEAAEDNIILTTPAKLSIPTSSTADCPEEAKIMLTSLQVFYPEAETAGCRVRDYQSVADFKLPVRMIPRLHADFESAQDPVFIAITPRPNGSIKAWFKPNLASFETFRNSLPEDLTRFAPKSAEVRLSATLHNDMRDAQSLLLPPAFIDGKPLPPGFSPQVDILRRETIEIVLSDVASHSFSNYEDAALIAIVVKEDPLPEQQ